jgi:hypothetical protein
MSINPIQFIKNILNQKINPATQGTLASIKTDADSIVTNTAAIVTNTASLQTNTANIPTQGWKAGAAATPIALASNQPTLPVSGKMTFTPASTPMIENEADSIFYLRKILKQLVPKATVDSANRQRIVIDGSTDMTLNTTTVVTAVASEGLQKYQDVARDAFARGIRSKLQFS